MLTLYEAAIAIIVIVLFLAPVSIWIMVKYFDIDRYRKRHHRTNPEIFHRDREEDSSEE